MAAIGVFRVTNNQDDRILRSVLCMRYEYQRESKKDRGEETPMHERHR
jgi:hypothetical protein